MALSAFGQGSSNLQWQPAGVKSTRTKPAADGSYKLSPRRAAQIGHSVTQRSATRSTTSQYKYPVRQVAYNNGPQFGSVPRSNVQRGSARAQGFVVSGANQPSHNQIAQSQFAQNDANDLFGDELEKQFEEPLFDGDDSSSNDSPSDSDMPKPELDTKPDLDEPKFEELPPKEEAPKLDPFDEPKLDQPKAQPGTRKLPPAPRKTPERLTTPRKKSGLSKKKKKKDPAQERFDAMQDCSTGLAELKADTLNQVDINIGVSGVEGKDYPYLCTIDDGTPFQERCWPQVTYMWKASALCHKPLYFEDEHLERYGHSWGPYVQPLVSGAHFFTRIPVLPYCMGIKAPNECVYTLGHYRPGNCAPYMINAVPFTWRAGLFQAGAVTGAALVLP